MAGGVLLTLSESLSADQVSHVVADVVVSDCASLHNLHEPLPPFMADSKANHHAWVKGLGRVCRRSKFSLMHISSHLCLASSSCQPVYTMARERGIREVDTLPGPVPPW